MVARFDAVRLFIFVLIFWTPQPHFCDWVLGRYSLCLRACACHNTFVLYLAFTRVTLTVLLWM